MTDRGAPLAPERRNQACWTDRVDRASLTHGARRTSLRERLRERVLTDWYGPDLAPAEIAAHRSAPRLFGEILDEAMGAIGLADARLLDHVRTLWPSLVGPDVARRTTPCFLRSHVLSVSVSNPTWLYVLEREHRKGIEARLFEATQGAVRALRFVPPGRFQAVDR